MGFHRIACYGLLVSFFIVRIDLKKSVRFIVIYPVNPTKLESTLDVIDSFELEYIGFASGYHRTGKTNEELLQKAAELAEGADVVLLYIGLDEISESEGMDRDNMKIPENQIQLLKRLTKVNSHIVAVLSGGVPIEMDWIDGCEAVLHGYLSGQAGAAAMLNVIVGNVNPSGKLSETYPMRYEDVPSASYYQTKVINAEYREGLYVGYRYFETVDAPVRFPFGFGLSYTTFEYSNLKVSDKKVTFTLKNIGDMDGAEVVQLYVSARCQGIYRPKKERKGFTKVFLKVGQSKEVTITFDDKAFRYFNCLTNKFEVEGGEYEVLIAASSRDIRLKALVSVKGTDAKLPENAEQLPDYFTGRIKKISLICNGMNNLWMPIAAEFTSPAVYNILVTFITGGVSMVIFFFVFKIIFPEGENKK